MPRHPTPEHLGKPALEVDGFQLWVHGYQFPEAADYWDGNWLRITAHCGGSGASVWVSGALLMNVDLIRWADQCEALHAGRVERAELAPLEPDLKVMIRPVDTLGHFSMKVEITPEHMTQRHSFDIHIDQTFLPDISRSCRAIIRAYPVRGSSAAHGA